jgi:hypothetical protein
MKNKKSKFSKIAIMHYCKLIKRGVLLLLGIALYIVGLEPSSGRLFGGLSDHGWFLALLGGILFVESAMRLYPLSIESMGARKHMKKNYKPVETGAVPDLPSWKQTLAVAAAWVSLNAVFGTLYYTGVIDGGILVLISLFYSVCDMICILFFCPFQAWFLKNRCCASCRIYNWDFFMMATPLVFLPHPFAGVLVLLSLAVLALWEISYHRHPERFSARTNACLSCGVCTEKLCHHKKHLHYFWKNNKNRVKDRDTPQTCRKCSENDKPRSFK